MNKQKKQSKVVIYEDIRELVGKTDACGKYGLTYAVNYELAKHFGTDAPKTPKEKKASGGRRATGRKKNHHDLELPPNWFDLLEELAVRNSEAMGDTNFKSWQKQEYGRLAVLAEKAGLVRFVRNRGAVGTGKLKKIWKSEDPRSAITDLWQATAEKHGYDLLIP